MHSAMIAVAVYVVGGCVYQRNVMHQRGWRQLPNYAIWAGVGSFVKVRYLLFPLGPTEEMSSPERGGRKPFSTNDRVSAGRLHHRHLDLCAPRAAPTRV